MTSERESFREPPLVLCDGRLLVYADGEVQMFYGPKSCSWTTSTLTGRDIAQMKAYLPTLADNVADVYDQELTG